jgi:hypothetical protein
LADPSQLNLMSVLGLILGDLLKTEAAARDVAADVLKHKYGEAVLRQQEPLLVTDLGKAWYVEGSHVPTDLPPEFGPYFMRMRKADCCVEAFGNKPLDHIRGR